MLTRMLTAVVLAPISQVPAPPCTLAGPAVEARWSGAIPPASTAEAPLRVVADVPLPGSASRFDYQSLEPASGRLFISHMGAGQLVAFDVRAGRVIANLDGFPTVTGVLAVPVEHRADRKSTRLNSSHSQISYAVFCLKKKKHNHSSEYEASYHSAAASRCRSRSSFTESLSPHVQLHSSSSGSCSTCVGVVELSARRPA